MKSIKMLSTCTALVILAAAVSGCTGPGKAARTEAPPKAPASNLLTGKVLETLDSGGYTYINLEKDGKSTWVAAPAMKVSVGQELQLLPGAEMSNFSSKSLNRTFDKIVFSGGAVPAPGASAAMPSLPHAPAAKPAAETKPDPYEEAAEAIMTGEVVETIQAANYIYLRVAKDGKASWAAVPFTKVAVGDEIELLPGTPMGRFTSKTMNRTFNSILFASGLKVTSAQAPAAPAPAAGQAPVPEGHPKLEAAAAPQLPGGHPKLDAAENAAPAALPPIAGKVVETANAGGYTYICLEKDGVKTWVAVPTMEAKVGEDMKLAAGNVMTNFVSKSLNRTFEKIIFSSGPAQ